MMWAGAWPPCEPSASQTARPKMGTQNQHPAHPGCPLRQREQWAAVPHVACDPNHTNLKPLQNLGVDPIRSFHLRMGPKAFVKCATSLWVSHPCHLLAFCSTMAFEHTVASPLRDHSSHHITEPGWASIMDFQVPDYET